MCNTMETDIQKELYIATLTHDLKTPLLAQIRSLELLESEKFGILNEKQKEILDLTIESCIFMKEMLKSILLTYKYDNGIVKLDKTNINAEQLIYKCIKEFELIAEEKDIKIIFRNLLLHDNNKLIADESQIRRVIMNLLSNAVSYGYSKSIIDISIMHKQNQFVFEITNESDEISEDIKDHIFEKYVSCNLINRKLNFGLGLYYCKRVIEAHNGNIYLTSNGALNKFTFELPLNSMSDNKSIVKFC